MSSLYITKIKILFFFLISFNSFAQVGIGNINPNNDALLEIGDGTDTGGVILPRVTLISTDNFSPLSAHVQGMIVYNTVTNGSGYNSVTPGQYYNNGSKWVRVGAEEKSIDSVTLTTDYSLVGTGSFSDVPGMSLTFVARKSTVLVTLSGSGDANGQVAAGIGDFLIYNVTSSNNFGGTHQNLTVFDDVFGVLGSAWNIDFSKPLTGLTVGNTYTLKIQAFFDPILSYMGAPAALEINSSTESFHHHLTLSVAQ
jgi:hypothetical protein